MDSIALSVPLVSVVRPGTLALLLAASTVFGGLMAGLFFAYSASVVLALETLSGEAYTAVMQPINERILNAAFGAAFLGSIAVPIVAVTVVLLGGGATTLSGILLLAGVVVSAIGTVAVTVLIHVPMNDDIATWSVESPPADWAAVRARWTRWNHVRTAAAVASFVLYVGALVAIGA